MPASPKTTTMPEEVEEGELVLSPGGKHHVLRARVTLTPTWADQKTLDLLSLNTVKTDNVEEVEKTMTAFFPSLGDPITKRGNAAAATTTPKSPSKIRFDEKKEEETEASSPLLAPRPSLGNKKNVMFGSFRESKKKHHDADIDAHVDAILLKTPPAAAVDKVPPPAGDSSAASSAFSSEEDDSDIDDGSSIDSDDMKDLATIFWEDVPEAPADAILGIAQNFRVCTNPNKVNVCVGAYRDEHGKPWVLPSVRQAERILLEQDDVKEYLPIEGDREFIEHAMRFAYGPDIPMEHLAAVQTLSGTGACRLGGTFLNRFWPNHPIYVPTPTWGNHISIFKDCGLDVRKYRYYNRASNGLDYKGMLRDLNKAPNGSIILLHACAHNPTGCDPTTAQWKKIISIISHKEHVAFFDSAYQGFASGNAEEDAQPFRYAVAHHVPILLAQSFAKNFGLYGERCGTLSVVCGDLEQKEHLLSELRTIIRPMYSSPPRHGSSIVKTILSDSDKLKPQYYQECKMMSERIQKMRTLLVETLGVVGSQHDWSHVTKQIGMFAFTGLNPEMCQRLTNEYAIFLTTNGRISIAGLNESNIEYVANAIHAVSDGKSITSA